MEPTHLEEMEARLTSAVSERMLDLGGLRAGARVLDVACGAGEPAIRAARRVGPQGRVLGVDVSEARLAVARARAGHERLQNIEFRLGDAEELDTGAERFDVGTCRWGLMSMPRPVSALGGVRRALEPGGTFVAAVWVEAERIPWWTLPREVTARHTPLPPIDSDLPSAVRCADVARMRREFGEAGLRIEHLEESMTPVVEAADGADLARWVRAVFGRWVSAIPHEALTRWEEELAEACERHRVGPVIRLSGVTRLVVARPEARPA